MELLSVTTPPWFVYSIYVLLSVLAARLVVSMLKAVEVRAKHKFTAAFRTNFLLGVSPDERQSDYWHPLVLGLLEATAYPILMLAGNWEFIGAWIVLKTAGNWERWKKSRLSFNRFLIGNGVLLSLSYLFTRLVCR